MKIAIPANNGEVAAHFGHCAQFVIAEILDELIDTTVAIDNPGHQSGFLPRFLAEQGVNVLIAGGIGSSAVNIFNELGITVYTGAEGKSEEVLQQYLKGELQSTGQACPEHH